MEEALPGRPDSASGAVAVGWLCAAAIGLRALIALRADLRRREYPPHVRRAPVRPLASIPGLNRLFVAAVLSGVTGVRPPLPMPRAKREALALLRQFRITGLKIDSIGDDRIFCLTGPVLHIDNTMRRKACTVVLRERDDGDVECLGPYVGWQVGDPDKEVWADLWPARRVAA